MRDIYDVHTLYSMLYEYFMSVYSCFFIVNSKWKILSLSETTTPLGTSLFREGTNWSLHDKAATP